MRRLILIDHSLVKPGGHYFEYTQAVAQAAVARGLKVTVLANRAFAHLSGAGWRTDDGAAIPVVPWFAYGWDRWSDLPADQPCDGHFGFDVEAALAGQGADSQDHVLIHTLGWSQLRHLLWTLSRVPSWRSANWPRFSILLRYDPDELTPAYAAGLRKLFADLSANPAMAARVAFHADTDALSALYQGLFKTIFVTLPIPINLMALQAATDAASARPASQPLTVTYLGDARDEKGYPLLPTLADQLWQGPLSQGQVQLVLQSNFNIDLGEAEAAKARIQLQQFPEPDVRLICNPLDTEEYYRLLAMSDIILLPYDAGRYRARSSGILVQAQSAGKIVVSRAGTWMATRADAGGMVLFDDDADFGTAVATALRRHAELRAQALACQPLWRAEADPGHFVDCVLAANARPLPVTMPAAATGGTSVPHVLFVMDGDAMLLRNGAAQVAHGQLRRLFAGGFTVTALFVSMNPDRQGQVLFDFARDLEAELQTYDFCHLAVAGFAPAADACIAFQRFDAARRNGEHSIDMEINYRHCLHIPDSLSTHLRRNRPMVAVLNYVTNLPLLTRLLPDDSGGVAVPIICELHDIQSFQKAIYHHRAVDDQDMQRELTLLSQCQHLISLSAFEADIVRRHLPTVPLSISRIELDATPIDWPDMAGCHDLTALVARAGITRHVTLPARSDLDLLYVSSAHKPNVDGLRWFIDTVFLPRLAPSGLVLVVAGSIGDYPGWPQHPQILWLGRVDNLRPLYAACRLVVLPVRSGAGRTVKVAEAIGMGKPLVATHFALRCLSREQAEMLVPCDTGAAFATRILLLLGDRTAYAESAAQIRRLAHSLLADAQLDGFQEAVLRLTGRQLPAPTCPDIYDSETGVWGDGIQALNVILAHLRDGVGAAPAALRAAVSTLKDKAEIYQAPTERTLRHLGLENPGFDRLLMQAQLAASGVLWRDLAGNPVSAPHGRFRLSAGGHVQGLAMMPRGPGMTIAIWTSCTLEDATLSVAVDGVPLTGTVTDLGPGNRVWAFQWRSPADSRRIALTQIVLATQRDLMVEDIRLTAVSEISSDDTDSPGAILLPVDGWAPAARSADGVIFRRSLAGQCGDLRLPVLTGYQERVQIRLLDVSDGAWRSLGLHVAGQIVRPASARQHGSILLVDYDIPDRNGTHALSMLSLLPADEKQTVALAAIAHSVSLLPPGTLPPDAHAEGHCDGMADQRVRGWIWCPEAPRHPLALEWRTPNGRVGETVACLSRPDVAGAGMGNGLYGYDIPVPSVKDQPLILLVTGIGLEIARIS